MLHKLMYVLLVFLLIIAGLNMRDLNHPVPPSTPKAKMKKVVFKNDFYSIKAYYPVEKLDKNKEIETFIKTAVDSKKEAWKIGGEIYQAEQELNKEFPDRGKRVYELLISYKKLESNKYNSVSYLFTIYEYTGGANGNIGVASFTFDRKGQVAIDDIIDFTNNNDIALSRILEAQVIKKYQNEGSNEASFKEMLSTGLGLAFLKEDFVTLDKEKCKCDGFFFGSNFMTFGLSDKGITFKFNKYQITPGVFGTPEIMLSWKVLEPYLIK